MGYPGPNTEGEGADGGEVEQEGTTLPAPDPQEGATAESEAETGRRDLKSALSSGELTLQGLFDASDSESGASHRVAGHMHVRAALLALPHVGEKKADDILDGLSIPHDRHIDALGAEQRKLLVEGTANA